MNINNHMHERNVAISLRVGLSITNHLKLTRIYRVNPVDYHIIQQNSKKVSIS